MYRFFVAPERLKQTLVTLGPPLSHQLSRVLRLQPGDEITLLDNRGRAFSAELAEVSATCCTVRIIHDFDPQTEPTVHVTLCQAMPKGKKIDWVLQKGTELGMSALIPMITDRSIVQDASRVDRRKMERWQRILTEAAEQSGRALIPRLEPAVRYDNLLPKLAGDTSVLVAAPASDAIPLHEIAESLSHETPISMFIGPEGGFSPQEIRLAQEHGATVVSMGPRILRTETAGMAALAILLSTMGDMG